MIKVGDKEFTNDELMAKVGAGHISHDYYKEIIAQHNAINLPVEEAPAPKAKGKKNANATESELA